MKMASSSICIFAAMILVLCMAQDVASFVPIASGSMGMRKISCDQKRERCDLSMSSSELPSAEAVTMDDVYKYGSERGTTLSLSTLGPGYRAVARASHDESLVLGYIEGFVRPGGKILHVDKMEVFRPSLKKAQHQNPTVFTGEVSAKVGMALGLLVFLHAKQQGCKDAEFLAIDDEAFQHKRLVRYFTRNGFTVYRYVGDDFKDVPDRLVWGGCGTLMGGTITHLISLWTDNLFRTKK
mmetsp:Transcript_18610/g.27423  ORF Transcript_18610/g.27423 Transcript_18610/m.27423 type:complete len:239 (+) Transcript_18610:34-750(+)